MGLPTLPGLLPLVALALMVAPYLPVALGMSTHKRHQEKRDIQCPQGKYKHPTNESICCLKCHKGTYLHAHCGGPDLATDCKTCMNNTYTEIENYFQTCHTCSGCRKEMGQVQKEACTVTKNTVCGCEENYYQQKQGKEDNLLFRCVPCNPCLNGKIQHQCTEKQDAVCICNQDFFWDGQKCIPCNECVTEKCKDLCPEKSAKMEESGTLLISLVIFLGFCCLSLVFIFLLCHYPRFKSNLNLSVRKRSPVKEEENQQPQDPRVFKLDSFPNLPSTPVLNYPKPSPHSLVPHFDPSRTSWWPSKDVQKEENVRLSYTMLPSSQAGEVCTAPRLDEPAMLYIVEKEVPPSRWKEFMRRLGLDEHDIELLELQNGRCLQEAHYKMLSMWQKGVPHHQDILEELRRVLNDMGLSGCFQNIQKNLERGSRPPIPLPTLPR